MIGYANGDWRVLQDNEGNWRWILVCPAGIAEGPYEKKEYENGVAKEHTGDILATGCKRKGNK